MIFNLAKGILLSLVLTVSAFSNAAIISFEFQSSETTLNYKWMVDSTATPIDSGPFGVVFATDFTKTLDTVITMQQVVVYFPVIGFDFSPEIPRITEGGFEFFPLSPGFGLFVASGPKLFTGDSPGNFEFTLGQFDMVRDVNAPIPTEAGTLVVREVSAPSALAILGLGLLGLASRRFKK